MGDTTIYLSSKEFSEGRESTAKGDLRTYVDIYLYASPGNPLQRGLPLMARRVIAAGEPDRAPCIPGGFFCAQRREGEMKIPLTKKANQRTIVHLNSCSGGDMYMI